MNEPGSGSATVWDGVQALPVCRLLVVPRRRAADAETADRDDLLAGAPRSLTDQGPTRLKLAPSQNRHRGADGLHEMVRYVQSAWMLEAPQLGDDRSAADRLA